MACNHVMCYSKFQMKKTMARLGFGSEAEYSARLFFRDGSRAIGCCDELSVARHKKDCWTNAIEVVNRDFLDELMQGIEDIGHDRVTDHEDLKKELGL